LETNPKYLGTGLGLAICTRIVDNHNGFIWAKSEPNEGARFYIFLPKGAMV
jgi:signal transduction histidine kinase